MQRESLYNPCYIYDSINEYPNMFSIPENNFLKFLKVVPNNKEIICISEKNEISLMKFNISSDFDKSSNFLQEKIKFDNLKKVDEAQNINFSKIFNFKESNHVYDSEM